MFCAGIAQGGRRVCGDSALTEAYGGAGGQARHGLLLLGFIENERAKGNDLMVRDTAGALERIHII